MNLYTQFDLKTILTRFQNLIMAMCRISDALDSDLMKVKFVT